MPNDGKPPQELPTCVRGRATIAGRFPTCRQPRSIARRTGGLVYWWYASADDRGTQARYRHGRVAAAFGHVGRAFVADLRAGFGGRNALRIPILAIRKRGS